MFRRYCRHTHCWIGFAFCDRLRPHRGRTGGNRRKSQYWVWLSIVFQRHHRNPVRTETVSATLSKSAFPKVYPPLLQAVCRLMIEGRLLDKFFVSQILPMFYEFKRHRNVHRKIGATVVGAVQHSKWSFIYFGKNVFVKHWRPRIRHALLQRWAEIMIVTKQGIL